MLILRVLIIFFIFTNLSYANDLLSYEKDSMVAIKALASNLKKSLKSVIKNSGPVAAVEYCNIAAFDITDKVSKENRHVVVDFICPTPQTRSYFNADFIIWMDTIKEGRFDDTNKMFIKPKKFDFRVNEKNAEQIAIQIAKKIEGV